jgi:hypothetical protein
MTWKRGCKVLALFTYSPDPKNSWVLVTGGDVGSQQEWFKLYDGGDNFGFINMYTTFAVAKQMNTVVDFELFDNVAAGVPFRIFQVYGW